MAFNVRFIRECKGLSHQEALDLPTELENLDPREPFLYAK